MDCGLVCPGSLHAHTPVVSAAQRQSLPNTGVQTRRRSVIGVQRLPQRQERGDAPGDVADLLHLVDAQRTPQERGLAVAESLLEHGIAAQGVAGLLAQFHFASQTVEGDKQLIEDIAPDDEFIVVTITDDTDAFDGDRSDFQRHQEQECHLELLLNWLQKIS